MATKQTQRPFIERLRNPEPNANDDPHEFARELTRLYQSNDVSGLVEMRQAYIVGIGRFRPNLVFSEIERTANDNLMAAARIGDFVAECGYEASGQIYGAFLIEPRELGPIATFYQRATGDSKNPNLK